MGKRKKNQDDPHESSDEERNIHPAKKRKQGGRNQSKIPDKVYNSITTTIDKSFSRVEKRQLFCYL
jgi:hypothetical protein